jgi:hypothetical protein
MFRTQNMKLKGIVAPRCAAALGDALSDAAMIRGRIV